MTYAVPWYAQEAEYVQVVVDGVARKTLRSNLGISKAQFERYLIILREHPNTKRRFDFKKGQQRFNDTQCEMLFKLRSLFLSANEGGQGIRGWDALNEYLNYPGI